MTIDTTLIGEFKPCKIVLEEAGITEFVFEDTAYIAKPVVDGEYHSVDWLVAMDDGRCVGLQFWKVL